MLTILDNFEITGLDLGLALMATLLLGMGKSGIKGLGVIIVTLMALVFGSKASTGILMPMMITADIFAVIYYHRHTQWYFLKKLLPMMAVGVLLGVWWGNDISEAIFKQVMAVFILLTVVVMIWMDRTKTFGIPKHWAFAGSMGLLSGITSMIGNLAGSFASIYFLAMRLPKNEFIGTAAWLFFIINVFKLPFHILVWKTVNAETLTLNLILSPAILIGFFLGIRLVKLINNDLYRKLVLIVTAAGALIILLK
ncbi:sulfite exporter TauE/SafE family protein [Lutimonas vermicola]|uniref:Probable membrane transporter protein n=1 Tax=Lutimonas vermicola TaxID=414288 RepID=A0ABU9KX75_9FLAO